MTDLINEILATLRHNKLRTALTGFAVSWGIFLLIVLLSVSQGLVNGMNAMFSKSDPNTMSIFGGTAHKPYQGLTDDRNIRLRERDIPIIQARNSDVVSHISAEINTDAPIISTSKDYVTGGYHGMYPSAIKADGLTMTAGRYINDNDMRLARRVIVLHQDNARNLFGDDDPIGQTVKVGDLSFTVIGVYAHDWNHNSFVPYTTARKLSGGKNDVNRIIIGVQNISSVEEATATENAMYTILGNEHNFDPSDKSALWVWNNINQYLTQSSATGALKIAVWVIGLLTMLSGIVGVSNIMFVSVRERTHEIGVRRAIGARPLSILKQVILESVAITTLFGYIGIVMGVALSQLIDFIATKANAEFIQNPTVDLGVALQVTLVLVIAGALAGLFPALKSLKIKPVEALRDE